MTGNYAAGGNATVQLKGAGQLAKSLKKAGADMKDLRDLNKQAAVYIRLEKKIHPLH